MTGYGFLILQRRAGERIMIDHPQGVIVVSVGQVAHGKTKLGVYAPLAIKVIRGELVEQAAP